MCVLVVRPHWEQIKPGRKFPGASCLVLGWMLCLPELLLYYAPTACLCFVLCVLA